MFPLCFLLVVLPFTSANTCRDACIPKGIKLKEGKLECCGKGKESLKCPAPAHYKCGGTAPPPPSPPSPPSPPVPPKLTQGLLVVAHDAGESLGLLPVVVALASASSPAAVLALGEPAFTIFSTAAATNDHLSVYSPKDLGVNVTIIDQTVRNQTLTESELKLCIAGMAYLMQLQFAAAFLHQAGPAKPSAVVGFDDGFNRFDPASLQGMFISGGAPTTHHAAAIRSPTPAGNSPTAGAGPAITDFFATASSISDAAAAYAAANKLALNVLATGSPTIASWSDDAANASQIALTRAALFGDDPRPAILYAGGYGAGSNESLRLFSKTVLATNASYQYAFSPHPGIPASRALAIFEECGVLDMVVIVDDSVCHGTGPAAVACNATVSEGSTVAVQSVFVGVPSFYIANSTADAANVLVDSGQIPVDTTVAASVSTLLSFASEGWHFDRSRLDDAGIPTNATAIMSKRIAELLANAPVKQRSAEVF